MIFDTNELYLHQNGLCPMLQFGPEAYGFKSKTFRAKSPSKPKTADNRANLFDQIIGNTKISLEILNYLDSEQNYLEWQVQKLYKFLEASQLQQASRCSFSNVSPESIPVLLHRCHYLDKLQLFFDPQSSEKLLETKIIQQKWDVRIEKNHRSCCCQIVKFGKLFK